MPQKNHSHVIILINIFLYTFFILQNKLDRFFVKKICLIRVTLELIHLYVEAPKTSEKNLWLEERYLKIVNKIFQNPVLLFIKSAEFNLRVDFKTCKPTLVPKMHLSLEITGNWSEKKRRKSPF
jgi:hypothetical protein